MLQQQLQDISKAAEEAICSAQSSEQLEALRIQYLGKKGAVTALLSQMGKLSPEERPKVGQVANEVRSAIESMLRAKKDQIAQIELQKKLESEKLDVTLSKTPTVIGKQHPLNLVLDEIKDVFLSMGSSIESGP